VLNTNYGSGSFYADHTSGYGKSVFLSNGTACTELIAAGTYNLSFWMSISSTPAENVLVGYCTSQSNIAGTFSNLQTVNNPANVWTNYNLVITLPVNSYITWNTVGGAKTHCIDDVFLSVYTGIENSEAQAEKISVYPVPADNELNIRWENSSSATWNFELYDISGKLIAATTADNPAPGMQQKIISTINLNNGLYFLKINKDGRTVQTEKFVILKSRG
jgi:hypothetical protein